MSLRSDTQKSAEVLDRIEPLWFNRIDCDNLRMWDCRDCILGQLYFDFSSLKSKEVRRMLRDNTSFTPVRTHLGARLWKQEIYARRGIEMPLPAVRTESWHPLIDALDLRRSVVVPDTVPEDWSSVPGVPQGQIAAQSFPANSYVRW